MGSGQNRIASLDGLRAISVGLVFLAHAAVSTGAPSWMPETYHYANLGVRTFFVISGFLITHLLLKERERTGGIDLQAFYVRRAYRILPAAYAYMAIVTVLYFRSFSRADLVTSYLYVANYHEHHAWTLGHLWSLGVEEQFYLLWPFAAAFLFARRRLVLALAILLAPAFRALFFVAFGRHWTASLQGVTFWFPSVADALATGCLLAVVRPVLDRLAPTLRSPAMLLVPLATLALVQFQRVPGRYTGLTYEVLVIPLIHLGIALTIDHCIRRRYWLLNNAPVVFCGVVSYSLYLWQQPFLVSAQKVHGAAAPWETFPLNVLLAFGAGCLSYYLVERPVLRYRERRRSTRALALELLPAAAVRGIDDAGASARSR